MKTPPIARIDKPLLTVLRGRVSGLSPLQSDAVSFRPSPRHCTTATALVLALTMLSSLLQSAQAATSNQVTISSAIASNDQQTLTIRGSFGTGQPVVALGNTRITVISSSTSVIQTVLPAGIVPGSYNLSVSTGSSPNQTGDFDVTIGNTGPQGPAGPIGPQGPVGPAGPQGVKGDKGDAGPQGLNGAAGPQGPQGVKGDKGDAGPQGLNGAAGPQGPQGVKGDIGDQGPQGVKGAAGQDGAPGVKGDTGAAGATGPQGEKGLNLRGTWNVVALYSPDDAVSYSGSSWVAKQANSSTPPAEGANWTLLAGKGAAGATGADGPAGPAGAQGPQGAQGEVGAQGPKGDTGATGAQGPQGAVGPQGA